MSREMDFFIYLLEAYAAEKGIPAGDVLRRWRENEMVKYVYGNYEIYHSEAIENAFEDIDSMAEKGEPAW